MGRSLFEATSNKGTVDKAYTIGYTYNLDGSPNTLAYPSGDVVTYTVGAAGRATQVSDTNNNFVGYAGGPATYAPQGALAGVTNGYTATSNFPESAFTYNVRLQPIELYAWVTSAGTLNTPAVAPVVQLCYDYHLKQAISSGACSFGAYTNGDNGNVFQIVNNADTTRSAVYTYDALNRIAQANTVNTTSSNCWGEAYTIDAWGNLYNRAVPPGMGPNCYYEPLMATATIFNQLSGIGVTYDAAGNVLNDGNGNTSTYDAENRVLTDAGYTYNYDYDGQRLGKASGSTGTMYWRGPSGTLTETDLTGTINEEYIYFNGARIARVDRPSGAVHYYFSNHLGSASVITDAFGTIEQQTDYYPFGGVAYTSGGDSNHYKFTGKERDNESGLDNFGARYNASTMGRFMSPDPLGGRLVNPQTLNKYSYTINNPLRYTDPTGLYVCSDDPKDGSSHCSSDNDKRFEAARQNDLQSKNADVVNAAKAYGDVNSANGVNVGFADLGKAGEGGITVSHLGADANGNLQAQSDVTINSSARGTALDADVGHEGSHVEDAQTMVQSITFDKLGNYKVGDDISQYRSEQRAYSITDAIYRSANEPFNGCGDAKCALGAGSSPLGTSERIDQIMLANPKIYHSADGKPLTSTNQGGNVLNITVPH